MMHDYYPKLLIILQFGLAGLMFLFSRGFFTSAYALPLFIMGLGFGFWALNHNKLGNFNIQPKLKEGSELVTTGIYRFIRHPMYTSVIIMMFAVFVGTPTLAESLLFLALVVVLVLKATREESLWMAHDDAYDAYRKRSKLFIPYIL